MAVAQWIGQWAWVIAPWFWIILYDPNWFESATEGARTLSIYVGLACMAMAMVPAIFCHSVETTNSGDSAPAGSIADTFRELFHGIVITLKNKPFQRICTATFFIFNAYNCVAGFAFFIIVYYMNGGDPAAAGSWPALFGSVSALCTCFLVIPIVNWMCQVYGKAQDLPNHTIYVARRLRHVLVELYACKPLLDVRSDPVVRVRYWRFVYHHDVDDSRHL